jgi:hypothetical protein
MGRLAIVPLQQGRLRMAPAAVGCKRLFTGWSRDSSLGGAAIEPLAAVFFRPASMHAI